MKHKECIVISQHLTIPGEQCILRLTLVLISQYRKRHKIGTLETDTVILIKYNTLVYNAVIHPKDADGMANNADPDQTPPLGKV